MSQSHDQATESTDQNQTQPNTTRPSTKIRDALAGEELQSAFDQEVQSPESSVTPMGSTDVFRESLAAAFAEESEVEKTQRYEPPTLFEQLRGFFSSFDFEDRSDKTKGFMNMSEIHRDILTAKSELSNLGLTLAGLSMLDRNRIQADLYELASFQVRAADYMEETRPTF
jgi:hypothetical protein